MQELDANTVLGAIPGRPRYVSWRVLRRIPLIVLPTAAVLALGVVFIYLRDRENDLAKAQAEAASVVQVQARIVGHEVEAVRSIVGYLAREPILKAYLRGEVTRSELEGEWIRLLLAAGSFHQIRLLDPLGREQVRVNQGRGSPFAVPENELQEKSTRYYFEKAWPLESEQVYVSPLDLNVEHGVVETPWKPMLRFATPVYDADGAKRGILVLNYEGDRLIERMRRSTSYASGWTWLVDVDGYYLQGPRMADSWAFMFGLDPTFARDYPGAWERISAVPESLFAKPKGVFAAKRVRLPHSDEAFAAVGELDLHVVTFVPSDVIYASSQAALRRMAAVAGLLGLVLFAGAWKLAHVRDTRRIERRRLQSSELRLRHLSRRLLEAQEIERRSLSRDLHDEIGQLATATTIHLKQALLTESVDRKNRLISRSIERTGELLGASRSIASRLRTSVLDDIGLESALRQYFDELRDRLGIQVDAELGIDGVELSTSTKEHIYRVIQEALTNVARHAGVKQARVELRAANGLASIRVSDLGVGFDTTIDLSDRFGVLGMRERAELLNGDFRIESSPGKGTTLEVLVPLRHLREEAA